MQQKRMSNFLTKKKQKKTLLCTLFTFLRKVRICLCLPHRACAKLSVGIILKALLHSAVDGINR